MTLQLGQTNLSIHAKRGAICTSFLLNKPSKHEVNNPYDSADYNRHVFE